jgi:hemoglobin
MESRPEEEPGSLYTRVGGDTFFERLIAAFYRRVAVDDVLAPLYPERPDFTGAQGRLTGFLIQYWGGPDTYSQTRGHPKLRLRHLPFTIGPRERDRWLVHMAAAVEEVTIEMTDAEAIRVALMTYFVRTAEHLRNDTGLPITSAGYEAR